MSAPAPVSSPTSNCSPIAPHHPSRGPSAWPENVSPASGMRKGETNPDSLFSYSRYLSTLDRNAAHEKPREIVLDHFHFREGESSSFASLSHHANLSTIYLAYRLNCIFQRFHSQLPTSYFQLPHHTVAKRPLVRCRTPGAVSTSICTTLRLFLAENTTTTQEREKMPTLASHLRSVSWVLQSIPIRESIENFGAALSTLKTLPRFFHQSSLARMTRLTDRQIGSR
jgi:hypothetical protein